MNAQQPPLGEVISIGTELLMGEIIDTDAAYIAGRLPALGIRLRWVTQVGDDLDQIVEALQRGLGRSDIIVTTGGLGPTEDDLTREAIAKALGEEMRVDEGLLADLRRFMERRGVPMPPSNIKQATLVPSARPLPNPRGTAPGWLVEKGNKLIISLPGVPHEMERMWQEEVAPRLRERLRGKGVILSRTIKTFGVSESLVGEKLKGLFGKENPYLGIYAKPDGIHLRLIALGRDEGEARCALEPVEAEVIERLGPIIWGYDEETPELRIAALLRSRSAWLATMESLTGGLLASTITDVPGSSEYFRGGVVTYSNEAKVAHGVPADLIAAHGAVSPEVAQAMAQAVRKEFGADYGLAVTGVAGPAELEGKPVGTVHIGLAWPDGTRAVSGRYPPTRQLVKRRAVVHALLELARLLSENPRLRT
ncbi:MAG: competence/damage-inducible protein A [Chloroflexi bacterium]|nr:competence/damage-inducible protein A [Chloroflexota bacterium]